MAPKLHRRDIRMTADEWEQLDAAASRADRTGPWLLRYFVRAFSPHVRQATLPVGETPLRDTVACRQDDGAATVSASYPDPAPPPAEPPDPDQEKKDQDQKEQDRKGDARGKPDLNGITYRVIAWINEIRPAKRGFEARTYRPDVGRLLKRGHKESELIEVVEWRAEECRRTGDWLWFKPGTLFRVTEFAKRLDESRAGVEHGKGSSRRGQRELYETPDATDAIWMKGVDNA